jgi:hypothetical protein
MHTKIPMTTRSIFFIDPEWPKAGDVYKKMWHRAQQPVIRNIAAIRRKHEKLPTGELDCNKARSLRTSLKEMFKLGKASFKDALQTRGKIILTFDGRFRDIIHDHMARLAGWYPQCKPEYRFWEWMGKFLRDKLMITGRILSSKNMSGYKVYQYELDMTDWIYYQVRMRED